MKNEIRLRKIIWAVDPFDESETGHEGACAILRSLHERTGAEVIPVSVLGPYEGWVPSATLYADPSFLPKAREAAEQSLRDLFGEDRPAWVRPPRLIVESAETLADAVELLVTEARREDADLIVTRSHGRQGVSRFFVGSFAETLINYSPKPVLILGGHATGKLSLDHVVFPTDFGERSRASYRWVVEWTKATRARLTLFHALSPPEDAGLDFDSSDRLLEYQGETLTFREVVERQAERQVRRAAAWAERGASEGIEADFMIDDSGGDLEAILRDVGRRSQCDLVVMESHDHPLRTAWLGSRSRDVLRSVECPVLILPPLFLRDWIHGPGETHPAEHSSSQPSPLP